MSTQALTVLQPGAITRNADWLRAACRARLLSWISLVWMGAEGALAITLGFLAGSIASIGFGLDSAIEGFASLVIVWRFTGSRLLPSMPSAALRSSSPSSSSCSYPRRR